MGYHREKSMHLVMVFLSDKRGATSIEYALIAAGVSIAIVTVVTNLGTTVNGMYSTVAAALK